jgi:ATP-dependent helicase/nuclease subunit B
VLKGGGLILANQLNLVRIPLTEIAAEERLAKWYEKQKRTEKTIYYLLPSLNWLRIARKRQQGLMFATFDDLAKLLLDETGIPYFLITELERRIFMQEIQCAKNRGELTEEQKNQVTAFADTYGQLKRLGFHLEHLPTKFSSMLPLFQEYERQWTNQNYLDPENLILQAMAVQPRTDLPISEIVIDGFYDLGPLQFLVLAKFVQLQLPITIYLPDFPNCDMANETKGQLEKMGFHEADNHPIILEPRAGRTEVLAASTREEEIYGVLDRIMDYAQGEPFDQCGVVFASEWEYLSEFQRLAKKRGIPLQKAEKIPLTDSAIYQLFRSSVGREQPLRSKWEKLECLEQILQLLFISPNEYTDWKRNFLQGGENTLPRFVVELLDGFVKFRSKLPKKDTIPNYLEECLHFVRETKLPDLWRPLLGQDDTCFVQQVVLVWKGYDVITHVIESKIRELQDKKAADTVVHLTSFIEWLDEAFANREIFVDRAATGGVHLHTFRDAAQFSGRHLFVLGMNEGKFPIAHQLLGYFQEKDLAGLPIPYTKPNGETFALKQDALFYQLDYFVEHLIFSYVAGVDLNHPLLPSKYIQNIPQVHFLSVSQRLNKQFQEEYVFYSEEDRLEKIAYHFGLKKQVDNLPAELIAYRQRLDRLQTGEELLLPKWQGAFQKSQVAITQLESYAACPFRYAMENIFHVMEPMQPQEDLDARDTGTFFHHFVEQFYTKLGVIGKTFAEVIQSGLLEQASQLLVATFDSLWAEVERNYPELTPVQRNQQRERWWTLVLKWWSAERFHFWENPQLHTMQIRDLEKKVGLDLVFEDGTAVTLHGKVDRIDGDENGFVIYDYKTGKASMSLENEVKTGLKLQLPLYIQAIQKELGLRAHGASYISLKEPAKRATNGIWHKDHAGKQSKFYVSSRTNKEENMDAEAIFTKYEIKPLIQSIWQGMSSDFSVRPRVCHQTCPFRPICRVTREQIEEL